jgi:hypothetical protein
MRCDKAMGAKVSEARRVSTFFDTGCFTARQGLFVIPWKCADSCYQSSTARLLPSWAIARRCESYPTSDLQYVYCK